MSKLELILLGQFECLLPSGTRISLSMRKAEVLLAYLALTPGLRHPRERLINLLWSDRGEEQARNSLRQCLSAIRKSLGDVADLVLHVDRTTVSLIPELIDIDVHEFERLAAEGGYESLTTAADLYQGEFLEGIAIRDAACQEWLDNERSRFKRQFIEILLNLAETQLVSHDFSHAIQSAERLVKQDPLGESGWRLLMRSYSENGDRAHALQAFKRCQQALRDELEVEPESATIELRDHIAGGEPSRAPAPGRAIKQTVLDLASATDHSIAVLPFDNLSGDPEQEYFSDGITDSIILNLSLFPGLNVKSRNSSFAFKQQIKNLGEISKELGVDYIVEGNIRRSEHHVRITVQLIEAEGGNQIWGKRYDADLTDLFTLEEELSRAIAATVTGQIESELQRIAIAKGAAGQESYDLLLSGIYHNYRFNRQDTVIAIEKLDQCLALDPDNMRAHKQLYNCHLMNYLERWTEDYQASFELAARHIQKALALAPDSGMVQVFYAQYLVFRGEFDEAASYLDKALAINPNDPYALATQALKLEILGEAEAALQAAERACLLDPYHPWAEWEVAVSQFISGRYESVVDTIAKLRTSPGFIQIFGIASAVKLGKVDSARQVLQAFLQECRENMLSMPTTPDEWLRYTRENYPCKDPQINRDLIDCLLQAGLEDELTPRRATPESTEHSIAILPFDNLSGDPEQEYFSDGITDSIILHLSLFPGLNVKSRNSSFAFKQQIKSLGEISQELGVDYIVEGSIRKSGNRVRITVQLIEASSGNQVWGKRYDAEIEDLFDLEEDLSRTIAATVTGQIESDLQRIALAKGAADQQAYDLLLSGIYHFQRFTRQDTVIAIDELNQCLDKDPDNVRAHVVLYECHGMDYLGRWTRDHKASFRLGEQHIRRAMELDSGFGPAQVFFGEFLTFNGELDRAATHIDKALEINPNDTDALTTKAVNLQAQCKFEAALEVAERVVVLDPHHPWAEWEVAGSQYFCGRYEDALETIAKFRTSPGFVLIYGIAANVKLGRTEAARQALQEFLLDCRESMLSKPQTIDEWYEYTRENYRYADPRFNQDLLDCLVEAGLGEADPASAGNTESEVHSIAVLPFDNLSGDPSQEYFSDGISESIILNLSMFPGLRVKSRNSSFAFKQQIKSPGEISRELAVDYVLEGSLRKSKDRIRITVQLIDAQSDDQIWGKRYDSDLEDLFDLEEALSRTIAATVTGQIESNLQRVALAKPAKDQNAYDLLLEGLYHHAKLTPADTVIAIEKLNQCLARDPDNVRAHVSLYECHIVHHLERWTSDYQESYKLAKQHIETAISLDPDSAVVQGAYSEYMTFCHQYAAAIEYADKALQINPNDPTALSNKAFTLTMTGEYRAAFELARRAKDNDPYHPWADWNLAEAQIFSGQYEDALRTMSESNMAPELFGVYAIVADTKLGNLENARLGMQKFLQHCRDTMQSMPVSLDDWLQYLQAYVPSEDPQLVDDTFDCLVQAGLQESTESAPAASEQHSDHVSSIVVLPFDNLSGDPEQEYFSDGITDSIILNLSLFPDLSVKSRHASFAFKQQLKSVGDISRELGVDYVVEGSIRKSNDRVRITVQLVEGASGNQVWGKRYDAELDSLFDLEEELSRSIAATVTGQIESELQRFAITKGAVNQQAYDLLLAGEYHLSQHNASDNQVAIERLNQCLARDPDNVRAHVILYYCHMLNLMDRWIEDFEQSRKLAEEHILKAVLLDPGLDYVQVAYAEYLTFQHRYDEADQRLKQVLENNPNKAEAIAERAVNLSCQGKAEAALEQAELAIRLDPYQSWYKWIKAESQFFCKHYEDCLATIRDSSNTPGFIQIYNVAANIKLGRLDDARNALTDFLGYCRENMLSMPQNIEKWRQYYKDNAPFADTAVNEIIIKCMLQAGLEENLALNANSVETTDLPSILVLPFNNLSGDPEQEYFSDGITESIIVNLGSFRGFRVKSRHASFAFKDSASGIDEIAAELGVQYIVEGSVRRFGDKVRITAQLADATSGNQVWGKRFDYALEDLFALEEELSQTIAGTVSGRVDREVQRSAMHKPAKDLKSYDYLLRARHHIYQFTADDYVTALELIEQCLALDPDNADAHSILGSMLMVQLFENWVDEPVRVEKRVFRHLERALDLDPDNAITNAYMAEALWLNKEFERGLAYANKAVELNPTQVDGYMVQALFAAMDRHYDKAVEYADLGLQIDPYHPYAGWTAGEVYRASGNYERAIATFRALPHMSPSQNAQVAACLAGLGRIDEARAEMRRYLELARVQMVQVPASRDEWYRFWEKTMPYRFQEDNDNYFDLLLQAGLCDDITESTDDIPSIAVLPFENMSGDPEQEYFSDGITTSIILSLGLYKGLTVKSQNSSFAYKASGKSSEEIARDLNTDYLVEGSVRKSTDKVRILVQLIESESGNQIWGKQYDAELEDILDLEQELSQTIAATISGRIGHTLQQSAIKNSARNLKSYDYLLRGLYHFGKFTAQDFEIGKQEIKNCLEIDPENATAHTNLGMIHIVELMEGWTADRLESEKLARVHLQHAIDIDPDNYLAHAYLVEYHYRLGDFDRAEFHADKAIELNPTASEGYTAKADLLTIAGRADEAVSYAELCVQLDPHSIGANWTAGGTYQAAGQYEKAIKAYRSISHPPASIHALSAACFIGLGLKEEAHKEMKLYQEYARKQMPNYPATEAAWRETWLAYSPFKSEEYFNRQFGQMLTAGLCENLLDTSDDMPSIAVLPFENMSGDPEQEHFSDGITADIISTLSKFQHLRTVSRYSTLQYKTEKLPIADIAQQQNARYILEGSVRKSSNHIRVNAELIDSADGQILWSERYDRDLDDLFAVQDEITKQIALAMKVQLDDGDMALHRSKGTSNTKAWELAMASVDLAETYIRQNILDARAMAMEAIELDPDYAYAWIALGWCYWQEAYVGWGESIDKVVLEAEKANRHAFRIDPDYSEAWSQLGFIHVMKHEPVKAIEACRRAVELEPGSAEIHALTAFAYIFNGDYEQAQKHNQNMLKLCPIRANWYYMIGAQIELSDGNLERAIELYRLGIQVEPDSPLCRFYLINAMMEKGDEAAARKLADEIRALDTEVSGKGMVHVFSYDSDIRGRFESNLAKFDLV